MRKHRVRIRYAGSVLVELEAEDGDQAREKGEVVVAEMDSDSFVSALELQHLDTEVMRLCSKCGCNIQVTGPHVCSACGTRQLTD